VDFVGATNDWMRDFRASATGEYPFKPDNLETRKLFARTLYRAFGSGFVADPSVSFVDLAPTNRFSTAANVAVSQGWLEAPDGAFQPRAPVTTRDVHRALVLALGLGDVAAGVDALHLKNGTKVPTPEGFGTLLVGMRLGLRTNHADDAADVGPDTPLSRAEVAWSLFRAATAPTWVRDSLAPYAEMQLPNLSPRMQQVVSWAARYVAYPYIWGAEWGDVTPTGYCCGAQPQAGFDCSGFVWWLMKRASGGWSNVPPREYPGWDLPERSSAQMASAPGPTIPWTEIRPGDLLLYDGNDDGVVDHVNVFIGNGWAVDASSGSGGVTFTRIPGGWYEEHFVHARRITKK
jgi:hypothetical protein